MIFYGKYIYAILGVLFSLSINAQNFKNKSVPSNLNFYNSSKVQSYSSVDLDRVLQKGLTIAETTRIIQRYIDSNDKIILPNRNLTISKDGLIIGSNKTLIFQKNTSLKIEANALDNYGILNIINVKNVSILNANLSGDRYEHKSKSGEWGIGIRILGSENIIIDNFMIRDCWGDGIYVGRKGNRYSKNVTILNGIVDNNRRNGISVTGVDGLKMNNVISSNSNGKGPEIGIDFEVNDSRDEMTNIKINNIVTYNNNGNGLVFSISKMLNNKSVKKNVIVDINNYSDYYSKKVGLLIAAVRDNFGLLSGKITLNNLQFNYNAQPFIIKNIGSDGLDVSVGEYVFNNQINKNFSKKEFERVIKSNRRVILK